LSISSSSISSFGVQAEQHRAPLSAHEPLEGDEKGVNSEEGSDEEEKAVPANIIFRTKRWSSPAALISEDQLLSIASDFIAWLKSPPMSNFDAAVKARRMTGENQLKPVRNNLAFITGVLLQGQVIPNVRTMRLGIFTDLNICKLLFLNLQEREVGNGRVHALFLLVKKILVFLASQQSVRSRQYLPPSTLPSFAYVDSVVFEAGQKRKLEQRNRALLKRKSGGSQEAAGSVPPAAASSSVLVMSKEELSKISRECVAYLSAALTDAPLRDKIQAAEYARYLVTATFALALAPRSQVLRNLTLNKTFAREEDGWWVRIPAELNKAQKPVLLLIPNVLTQAYDHYIKNVRTLLLPAAHGDVTVADAGFVFMNKSGGQKNDFSEWTKKITTHIIGRAINAHAFRHAVITIFYESGATAKQLHDLAGLMNHSVEVQREYYLQTDWIQSNHSASNRLQCLLETDKASIE
jgi:integrase